MLVGTTPVSANSCGSLTSIKSASDLSGRFLISSYVTISGGFVEKLLAIGIPSGILFGYSRLFVTSHNISECLRQIGVEFKLNFCWIINDDLEKLAVVASLQAFLTNLNAIFRLWILL